jgi:hypothetical protein
LLKLNRKEIDGYQRSADEQGLLDQGLTEEEVRTVLVSEAHYTRYTPAAVRLILREHVALSNRFACWLARRHGIEVTREKKQVDAVFEVAGRRISAEFKNAYTEDTKRPIVRL